MNATDRDAPGGIRSSLSEPAAFVAPGRLAVAFEASGRPASLALADSAGALREVQSSATHSGDLLALLEAELRERDLLPAAIERLVVGLGPGSYTGLRVAAAAAAGLGRALGLPVLGLATIEASLFRSLSPGQCGSILADARGERFTYGRYRRLAHDLEALEPVSAAFGEALKQHLRTAWDQHPAGPTELWLAEAGAVDALGLGRELPEAPGIWTAAPAAEPRFARAPAPSAAGLLELAQVRWHRRGASGFVPAEPLYLWAYAPRPRPER